MYNKILKSLAVLISLSFVTTPVSATLITDTVFVGAKEWAQIDLFNGVTWNELNAVCPGGVCTDTDLNTFDMDGWTWATSTEVGDWLFKPYFAHPGGIANAFNYLGSDLTAFISATGFRLNNGQFSGTGRKDFNGKTRDDRETNYGGAAVATQYYSSGVAYTRAFTDTSFLKNGIYGGSGAFLYRTVEVPEPSTIAIFALGLIGLASRRFKKQS